MPSSSTLVSLVVPVFNTENELRRCLTSLQQQTYQNLQVVVVNDGSTDQSAKIAREFCARDGRFSLHDKDNGGLSDARNFGFALAEGEYCGFIDSDDEIHAEFVEKLVNQAQALDADVVMTQAQVKDAQTGKDLYQTKIFSGLKENQVFSYKDVAESLFQNSVTAWDKIYRTDFLRKNNLHFLKGLHFEDLPFFAEVMTKAGRIGFVPQALYNYYVLRAGSITEKKSQEYLDIPRTLRHAQDSLRKSGVFEEVKASFLEYKWERMLAAYVMIKEPLKPEFLNSMRKEWSADTEDIRTLKKQIRFSV